MKRQRGTMETFSTSATQSIKYLDQRLKDVIRDDAEGRRKIEKESDRISAR